MLYLKIQYGHYESGEFTSEISVTLDSLLKIFEENTQTISWKYSYTINKRYIKFYLRNEKSYLRVSHYAKDAFQVDYYNIQDKKLHSGNFYKKSTKQLLTYFAEENYEAICLKIPRNNNNAKLLINSFENLNFTYSYKYRGYLSHVLNSVLILPLLCPVYLFLNQTFDLPMLFMLCCFLSPFLLLIIFLIRIDLNYVKNSKGKIITISAGAPQIKYIQDNQELIFNKSDIKEVISYDASGGRNPFMAYSFTKIILKNDIKIDISFMILENDKILNKLKRIPSKRNYVYYPYIK